MTQNLSPQREQTETQSKSIAVIKDHPLIVMPVMMFVIF